MELKDEAIPQVIQCFEQQLEAVRRQGVSPRFARIKSQIDELRKEPFSVEKTQQLISLADELRRAVNSQASVSAPQSTDSSSQIGAGQREAIQAGMKQALSTARDSNRGFQKELPKRARRGRRNMI